MMHRVLLLLMATSLFAVVWANDQPSREPAGALLAASGQNDSVSGTQAAERGASGRPALAAVVGDLSGLACLPAGEYQLVSSRGGVRRIQVLPAAACSGTSEPLAQHPAHRADEVRWYITPLHTQFPPHDPRHPLAAWATVGGFIEQARGALGSRLERGVALTADGICRVRAIASEHLSTIRWSLTAFRGHVGLTIESFLHRLGQPRRVATEPPHGQRF